MQSRFDAMDHQGMSGVVTTLKANHALGALRQPVHQLALAFVTPLGSHNDYIATFACIHFIYFIKEQSQPSARLARRARGHIQIRLLRFHGLAKHTPRFHHADASQ